MNTTRATRFRSLGISTLGALAISTGTYAELVNIAWDSTGVFEKQFTLAPKRFAEACGKLDKGQSVEWTFTADHTLDFNIHYHADQQVILPVKRAGIDNAEGVLIVDLDQTYCWMWTNNSAAAVELNAQLRR